MKKLSLLKSALLLCALVAGSGSVWAQKATVFLETFGSVGSNPAYDSHSDYSTTSANFITGTATTNYTGVGKVGKNTTNPSSGYTGASGNSGAWHQAATGNNTGNLLQIDNIKISNYKDLTLSFGAYQTNGDFSTKINQISVKYQIDEGEEQTMSLSGLPTSTATWTLATGSINGTGNKLTLKFVHTTSGGYTYRIDDIKIDATPTVTPAKTFTTYVPAVNLDFTSTDKLTAYIATAASASAVTLTSVDKVPAGTPIVVKATQTGSAISVDYAATTDDVSGNKLLAGDGTTEIGGDGKYDYILKDGFFCRVKTASALAAGKCYLHLDSAPTGANELTIDFEDGGVTGIQTVESQKSLFDGDFYNLAGQKVQNPTRGLYIVNGKKVIIK